MIGINEIVVATSNRGKLEELRNMLAESSLSVALYGLTDFDKVPAAAETGNTFAENARQKARHYSRMLQKTVLADDSGLEVAALDGAPGIYSARFAGVDGPARDRANNEKLLRLLKDIPGEKRQARFCCALCLCSPRDVLLEVEGHLDGYIGYKPAGENGFGYDPIFYLRLDGKSVAELAPGEKNRISHRGQALQTFIQILQSRLQQQI